MQLSELPELLKHQVIEGAGCQIYALGQREEILKEEREHQAA